VSVRAAVLGLLGCVALATPAAADAPDSAPAAGAAQQATTPSVNLTVPDPKSDPHLAKAMTFLEVSGARDLVVERFDLMFPELMKVAEAADPHASRARMAEVADLVRHKLEARLDELMTLSARSYALHFSDSDLDALIAFYKSDVGQKYLKERPAIVREQVLLGKAWGEKVVSELSSEIQQDMTRQPKSDQTL
jgi:hypothetical protein